MTDVDVGKTAIDVVAVAATGGTLMNILPPIAAILSIIWLGIRIWESETVRAIYKKLRNKRGT